MAKDKKTTVSKKVTKAPKEREDSPVIDVLNQQVANFTVMFTKIHNYHWYVKGPNFFSLHVKFEEMYNEVSQYLDVTAERVLAINGHPVATLKECLDQSIIKEAGKNLTAEEMVRDLSEDLQKLIEQLKEGQHIAEEAKDEMTADMILGMITQFEKHNWMFASYLGK